jgi:hypothetical protein
MAAKKLPKIYFDACVIIDMAEYEATGKVQDSRETGVWVCRQALRAARDGKMEVFTSIISIAECVGLKGPGPVNPKAKAFLEGLLLSGKSGIRSVASTMSIMRKARDLRWVHEIGMKGADSIHVSSALSVGCDEIWTGDRGIKNKSTLLTLGLLALKPNDSKLLPPDYASPSLELGS